MYNAAPDDRRSLEFLLGEMARWRAAGRIPAEILDPLFAEYSARRRALEPAARPAVNAAPGIPAGAFDLGGDLHPSPGAEPARGALTAFFEERNLATLHIAGAALLLAGLVALVRWQWNGVGRGILQLLLIAVTAGLWWLGASMGERHPRSGRALRLIALSLVPIDGAAANLLLGLPLSWEWASVGIGAVSALAAAAAHRRHPDPMLIPLGAAGAAAGVVGLSLAIPVELSALRQMILHGGLMGLAAACLLAVHPRNRGDNSGSVDDEIPGRGVALGVSAVGLGLASVMISVFQAIHSWPADSARLAASLVGLVAAGLCATAAARLKLPTIAGLASGFVVLAALALLPAHASVDIYAVTLAATSLVLAVTGAIHRRMLWGSDPVYQAAGMVCAGLAAVPLLFTDTNSAALVTVLAGLALSWRGIAAWERDSHALYATGGLTLAALRVLENALRPWFFARTGAPLPDGVLMAIAALPIGLTGRAARQPETARVADRTASLALVVVGLLQSVHLFDRAKPSGIVAIGFFLIVATALSIWSGVFRKSAAALWALLPLGIGYTASVLWHYGDSVWPVSPLWLAAALGIVGSALRTPGTRPLRFILWLSGASHALVVLLPPELRPLTPAFLAPLLLACDHSDNTEDSPSPRSAEALAPIVFVLGLVLIGNHANRVCAPIDAGALALTMTAIAIRRQRTVAVGIAALLVSAGGVLAAGNWPHWNLTTARTGLAIAVVALPWTLLAAFVRGREWAGGALAAVAATLAAIGGAVGLVGALETGQGATAVTALTVATAIFGTLAGLRRNVAFVHAAFASGCASMWLVLFDRLGFSPEHLEWYALPLGAYLSVAGERLRRRALTGLGVALLLGTSLWAIVLEPDIVVHPFLLVAECLAAIGYGIVRHVRLPLAAGMSALIALLALKTWEPLRQINFGVYLTLLGVSVLTVAVLAERRRDDLRRFLDNTRIRFADWE